MADRLRCPRCGAPLIGAGPAQCCPGCLLALAVDAASGAADDPVATAGLTAPPLRIGPYRILETLGEGGMGTVYLAEQDEPLRRRVAIKVIKLGMNTREVVARFDSERQAVALMDHPNIASVYDAGATEDGRPYFVMEYVPGVPITEYCDDDRLDTRARLVLFTAVCAAVQHAHQKGIIHRDLKPTNVLVMKQDGRPVSKVIDFGIAKAIDQRLTEKTLFTAYGLLVGTPEYMSPEQAALGEADLDTRTDIYSLGVLLYELLVGALPFEIRGLRRAGDEELRRVVREEEPVRPSIRLDTLGADAPGVAERRRTETTALRRQLRGDLDWIVLKAIDKDPARRYASASEFAADVARHLSEEPVAAGPPNRSYRLGKFVRKNRTLVTSTAAVLIVLLAGFVTSSVLYLRSEAALARAEVEAARNRIDADSLQAALWLDPNKYRELSTQAMTLHRRTLGPGNPALASHLVNHALVSEAVFPGRWMPETQAAVDEALVLIERGLESDDASVVTPLLLLSDSNHVDDVRIRRLRQNAFALLTRATQRDTSERSNQANELADLLQAETADSIDEADLEQAIHTAREVVHLRRTARSLKPDALTRSLERLVGLLARNADRLSRSGNVAAAEDAYGEAISRAKESGTFTESQVATMESELGRCMLAAGRFAEAEPLMRESHAVLSAKLGSWNAASQQALSALVDLYDAWDKPHDSATHRAKLPTIHVAKVSDLGVVQFIPGGSRAGGFSARTSGSNIWVFDDTWLPAVRERPEHWLDTSWGWVHAMPARRGLTVSSARTGQAAPAGPLIRRTDDEVAADAQRQSRHCREDCGFRVTFRPGPVIWDGERKRTLLFYAKNLGPGGKERYVGSSLAMWPDLEAPAVRSVLRGGAPEPTLLFGADEPPWGSGALTVGESLYAYACSDQSCLVARVPLERALERASWRFYAGNAHWSDNWRVARPVLAATAPVSVHWNTYLRKYVAVSSRPLSHQIEIQTADRPEGPWSEGLLVEGVPSRGGFPWTHTALAHPEISRDGGRVETLTYIRGTGVLTHETRVIELEFRRR